MSKNKPYLIAFLSFVILVSTVLFAEEPQINYHFEYFQLTLYGPQNNVDELNILWKAYFSNGVCEFYGNGIGEESGTYTATEDSIFISISKSVFPERNGISMNLQWWENPEYLFYFTNSQLVTMNIATSDTIQLMDMIVGVESKTSTWKEVKQLFTDK